MICLTFICFPESVFSSLCKSSQSVTSVRRGFPGYQHTDRDPAEGLLFYEMLRIVQRLGLSIRGLVVQLHKEVLTWIEGASFSSHVNVSSSEHHNPWGRV